MIELADSTVNPDMSNIHKEIKAWKHVKIKVTLISTHYYIHYSINESGADQDHWPISPWPYE